MKNNETRWLLAALFACCATIAASSAFATDEQTGEIPEIDVVADTADENLMLSDEEYAKIEEACMAEADQAGVSAEELMPFVEECIAANTMSTDNPDSLPEDGMMPDDGTLPADEMMPDDMVDASVDESGMVDEGDYMEEELPADGMADDMTPVN
ncbi:MAG: hypothetical protein KDI15_00615 [Thiothrix sp.]|nr:hypothetical protein [Thiothrix sp.]HPE59031.1 hypothetical protein [Thiolinea sp.]